MRQTNNSGLPADKKILFLPRRENYVLPLPSIYPLVPPWRGWGTGMFAFAEYESQILSLLSVRFVEWLRGRAKGETRLAERVKGSRGVKKTREIGGS